MAKPPCKSIFYVLAVNSYFSYIFKDFSYKLFGFLSITYFKISYCDTNFSNYLSIHFLEIFSHWFCVFNFYGFILQRPIWKMISACFFLFDYWTFDNEKLKKYRIILSQHTNYLDKWLVHLMFEVFSARFLDMCEPRTTFYLFRCARLPGLQLNGW